LDAGAGADSACDAALGLALRAWHEAGVNFLPHRGIKQQVLQRAWWLGMLVGTIGGAFLAAAFAMTISSAAQTQHPRRADLGGSARAYAEAQKDHARAKRGQQLSADQARWLQTRQDVQTQSLQWGRVLSQTPQGVWVSRVKQQGERWTVQGEALSSNHAAQLMRKLQALDIWTQTPALSQLQVMSAGSTTGMPIWQFRIEADLKGGV
jgi:type IV pilus assembly protein PilN